MKAIAYLMLIFPISIFSQNISRNYNPVLDYYSNVDIESIEINDVSIDVNYQKHILTINSIIKYNYGLICSDDGKVISRTYLNNNSIPVRLYKKETYFLRLDSYFSTKFYKIKI